VKRKVEHHPTGKQWLFIGEIAPFPCAMAVNSFEGKLGVEPFGGGERRGEGVWTDQRNVIAAMVAIAEGDIEPRMAGA